MHEDAIATVREEERDRLIHIRCLWSLSIGNEEIEFLPYVIESAWSLTTSVYPFARSKREYRFDGTTIVNATLHPHKRMCLYLSGIIIRQSTGMRQFLAILILHDKSPRIFLNLNATLGTLIYDSLCSLRDIPLCTTIGRLPYEHYLIVIVILRNDRRCIETHTNSTVVYWLYRELQFRTLVVCRSGEVEVLKRDDPLSVGIESLTGMELLTRPLNLTHACCLIKSRKTICREIGV